MKLFYVYENEDFVYLVTEYLPKPNLCKLVRFGGKLKEEIVKKIMKKLLETLGYMHSRGFVHRDLKLENYFSIYK
jgi:serine/threonine protein kinase